MPKDVRRSLPRVSYEQRIRLLGEDGKPLIVGRTMNLSPSGIYVRAPNGCEIGSEVTCDLPLPGGTRQLRGRVTRTEAHADDSTGIGIQFVDLTTGDSSSLHRVLEGGTPRPVAVKVMFEGMSKPIKCHGTVTADGIRLSTSLPFLRLGSDVQAVYDGQEGAQGARSDAKVDARGVLTGVRLEPVGGDGVPRLGVDVDIESQRPFDPSVARTPELSREDASVGGAFTAWDGLPAGAARPIEPAVVAELAGEAREVTAVRPRPMPGKVAGRMSAISGGAFVIVAIGTFGLVYLGITRLGPGIDESRRPEIAGGIGEAAPPRFGAAPMKRPPLVVPSSVPASVPPAARESEKAPESGDPKREGGPAAAAFADGDRPAARAGTRGRVRPRAAAEASPTRAATGSPFQLNQDNGRYELRPGATIDMKGEPLLGLGGIAAAADGKGTNMRGINVVVEAGVLYHEVSLPHLETDGRFGVQVSPSWPTTFAIVGKSPAGFTVSFGTPAPPNAHLDWFLIR
jgi:hypothetical protein